MDVDVVVLGTSLSESITAAALSKAGYKVAHIDTNPYYGGDDASLSLDELVSWADERKADNDASSYLTAQRKRFSGISYFGTLPPQSRQYAVSLQPTIIPSIGPLIDSLVASGVSRYGGFKLLERVAIYDSPGIVKPVPGSKEDVFKNKKLSLLHKRRLMRFLMFAGGDFENKPELQESESVPFAQFLEQKFSLDAEAIQVIVYALAFCISATDRTLPALQRIRRYLRSTGRYGPSSFLVGHYGGLGEIAQGFCRTSAVGGAIYILRRPILSIASAPSETSSRKYTLQLEDLQEQLQGDVLVGASDYFQDDNTTQENVVGEATSCSLARCIAIIDRPINFSVSSSNEQPSETRDISVDEDGSGADSLEVASEVDTATLIFPPSSLEGGSSTVSVSVLITGEGSQSAPRGKWILYITMPLIDEQDTTETAEQLLRPYLNATLSLGSRSPEMSAALEPLFTLFYTQLTPRNYSTPGDAEPLSSIIHSGSYAAYLPEIADSASINAEKMFWRAVKALKALGKYPQRSQEGEEEKAGEVEVESMWPPLEYVEDNDDW
ncbi:GDP dissociation inhibitor-domain-containing protein [Irpex rosettiformis]|uniref:GDP dissociation inhibitor-domain-containing protein n=1 Tax=Irpex rosettiformis TaxID=378272 RepID=A0ACB8TQE4_9APHY|nr:GDP dissociation inhibitor-domain-containing protein [Irpex rosettiformis]